MGVHNINRDSRYGPVFSSLFPGKIKTLAEVCESPHLEAFGMAVRLAHPKAGSITVMGLPVRLGEMPGAATTPLPLPGQHTEEILTRLMRIPKAKLDKLHAAGAV